MLDVALDDVACACCSVVEIGVVTGCADECAVTEDKLDATALAVWEETIRTLIKQFNGRMKTSCSYTIGLTDSDGNYLPVGLQVTDSIWTKVDIK